jgi:hypothetical protein
MKKAFFILFVYNDAFDFGWLVAMELAPFVLIPLSLPPAKVSIPFLSM